MYQTLKRRSDFAKVFREGRRRRRGDVTVVSASGRPGNPRVGLVAGKGVGTAVRRNRAKRRLREAIARVPLPSDTDYVVIASKGVLTADFDVLVRWLKSAVNGEEEM